MRRGLAGASIVGLLVALLSLVAAPAGSTTSGANPVIDGLQSRFLSTRPTVGPTWIVGIGGASASEQLMIRTLEGIVNRTQARLFLEDPGDAGAARWIADYQARGLVTVAGTTDIAGALDRFASEASGYVLASEAEPWTIDVATTIASLKGAVVATADQVPELQAHGLTMLDDTVGKWPDAATAYTDLAATYRARMPYQGIAILQEDDSSYDFAVQQGILTFYARPSQPDWPQMQKIIAGTPAGHAVYGYVSDTGDEEAIAVAALSQAGLFLEPSDTVRNLSFQIAVGANLARTKIAPAPAAPVVACSAGTLNVVVGITDGDNLEVPLGRESDPTEWPSPSRGELPLAWSIGPALAELAPAAWDTYASEATANDEIVGMLGYGYASAPLEPDPAAFYRDSFSLMGELGLRTFWSLGGGLESPSYSGWSTLDAAAGSGIPNSVLVGYGNSTGVGTDLYSPAGRPAFTSGTDYSDGPAQVVAELQALQDKPPAERPLVSFMAVSTWSNPVDQLIAALKPLQAAGVRFLTPSQAAACVPKAPPVGPPPAVPGGCLPHGSLAVTGLPLIRDAVSGEIERVPTIVPVTPVVTATPSVGAGGTIHYELTTTVDMGPLAKQILEERAKPLIEAGYSATLAATASVSLAYDDLTLHIPLAAGTTPSGQPAAASVAGHAVVARWVGGRAAPSLDLDLGSVSVDTNSTSTPFSVTVKWDATAASRPAPFTATVVAAGTTFELQVGIGVVLGTLPLTGAVRAAWSCTPTGDVLARTEVAAGAATTTTTTTTTIAPVTATTVGMASGTTIPAAAGASPVVMPARFTG